MYIAHKDKDREQLLIEHLTNTAKLAGEFAKAFNNQEYAYIIGLLHDIGKYSDEFQNRIKHNAKKCDHSTAGAREIQKSGIFGILGSYCIAGHHCGLQDIGDKTDMKGEGTLYSRLYDTYKIPNYYAFNKEINDTQYAAKIKPYLKPLNKGGFSVSFLIRMLFSALVDADYLDTESFMQDNLVNRKISYDFESFRKTLKDKINSFSNIGIINEKRAEILKNCINKANMQKGLFTLTVPTGGGKTIASMAFAINHLINHKMDRIIYVIPYTSIIEQNAEVFKNIFGKNMVLEHHSNFNFDDDEIDGNLFKLLSENWDCPFIVTTNVQFFESLFANKSSRCRKLHNIANSVIIFDEAQMLPEQYLTPCVNVITELVYNCNATAVLCSATQPALVEYFPKEMKAVEISENIKELYDIFKRTTFIIRDKPLNTNTLADEINGLSQCLCIVNTRKHALKLYNLLKREGAYHLSSLMCPQHRKEIIAEIKKSLQDNLTCRVVSTSLIEAGVDVDFPVVYRVIGGLDSVIQAAGRCNREGKLKDKNGNKTLGKVHVFNAEDEFATYQPFGFRRQIEITNQMLKKYEDISCPEAIDDYFKRLYFYAGKEGRDIKDIFNKLENGYCSGKFEYDFKSIAQEFKLINEDTVSVIIPFNDYAIKFVEKLKYAEFDKYDIRSIQSYSVNVYETEAKILLETGKVRQINDNIFILSSMDYYDKNSGLKIDKQAGIGIYI